jgi:hypothetical protein
MTVTLVKESDELLPYVLIRDDNNDD